MKKESKEEERLLIACCEGDVLRICEYIWNKKELL